MEQKLTFTLVEFESGPRNLVPADSETREYLGNLMPHSRLKLTVAAPPATRDQNAFIHVLYSQVQSQVEWEKGEVEAHCKLTHGVSILRRDDKSFADRWAESTSGLEYEQLLKLMEWFPVTRLMNKRQKSEYIDTIIMDFSKQGYAIALPGDHYA